MSEKIKSPPLPEHLQPAFFNNLICALIARAGGKIDLPLADLDVRDGTRWSYRIQIQNHPTGIPELDARFEGLVALRVVRP